MTRAFRAELLKLRRRSVVLAAASATVVFAAVTSLVTFLTATEGARPAGSRGFTATFASLARPDGGTASFADGVGFLGVILLATFICAVGFEYARGTFATALMKQPRRLRLLGGKVAALLAFVAVALAVAEGVAWVFALGLASVRGISTAAWFSWAGLGHAASAYGTAVFVVGSWALLGTTVAVFTRSVPIALVVAIAWAGPIEHITQGAWPAAGRWFPGLLLEGVAAGGNADTTFARAVLLAAGFVAVLTAAAFASFRRRDITA
jgi:ABC-type transport system involved in multi-copper enzyme maturation permease subunit